MTRSPLLSLAAIVALTLVPAGASAHVTHRLRVNAARARADAAHHRANTARAHAAHRLRVNAARARADAYAPPATASDYCPGADLTPEAGDLASVRAATLCLINGERARYGEPALIANTHLESAATGHSYDMVEHDYFEHVSPAGSTLLSRVRAAGFIPSRRDGVMLGENIAWGTLSYATPRSIVEAWMESPGHRANILERAYRCTGIGVDPTLPSQLSEGQTGAMYTQDFGTILAR